MPPFKPNVKSMKNKRDFDGLTAVLRSGGVAHRQEAVKALEGMGDESCKALALALRDESKAVRKAAATVLGRLATKQAATCLIMSLDDAEWSVRDAVVCALGETNDSDAVTPLIRALHNLDWYSADSVIEALGYLGDARAVDPLIEFLKHNDVNDFLLDSLGKMGEPAVAPLVEVMKNGSEITINAAASVLGRIGGASVAQLIELAKDDAMRKIVSETLYDIGEPAVESLVTALTNDNPNIRKTAIEVLEKVGYAVSCEPIIPLLYDENVSVRVKALEILDKINDDSIGYLLDTLQDVSPFVREKAIKVLGNRKSTKALEALTYALDDEYEFIRKESEEAIKKIKNKDYNTEPNDSPSENPPKKGAKFLFLLLLPGLLITYLVYVNYVRIFLK